MPETSFEHQCDRLSQIVDAVQFERMRWARTEAPMLERLVELAQAAIAERPDLELFDEGSAGNTKRFVLKVHGMRVVAITLGLDAGRVIVATEEIERSKFRLAHRPPVTADFSQVDAPWMDAALQEAFGRVES